jgi:hypothetical protein
MSVMTRSAVFNETVDMLGSLNIKELLAIQTLIKAFEDNHDEYEPLSEEEVFERIIESVAQANAGIYQDADIVAKEVYAELGL